MRRDHETPKQLTQTPKPNKRSYSDSAQSSSFSNTSTHRRGSIEIPSTSKQPPAKGQISHERLQKSKAKDRGSAIVNKFNSRSKQMKKQVNVLPRIKNTRTLNEIKMDVTDANSTKKKKREKRKRNDPSFEEAFGEAIRTKKAKTKCTVTPEIPPALNDTNEDDLPDLIRPAVTPRSVKDEKEIVDGGIISSEEEKSPDDEEKSSEEEDTDLPELKQIEKPTLKFDNSDESDDSAEEEESAPMPTINFDSDVEVQSSDSVICLDEEKLEGEHTASLTDDELEDF